MARKWAHLKEGEILRFSTQKHSRVAYQSFEHGGQIFEKFPKNRKKRATGRTTALFDYSFRFWIFRLFRFFGRKNRFFDFLEISKKIFSKFQKKIFSTQNRPKIEKLVKNFQKTEISRKWFSGHFEPQGARNRTFCVFWPFFRRLWPQCSKLSNPTRECVFWEKRKISPSFKCAQFRVNLI